MNIIQYKFMLNWSLKNLKTYPKMFSKPFFFVFKVSINKKFEERFEFNDEINLCNISIFNIYIYIFIYI